MNVLAAILIAIVAHEAGHALAAQALHLRWQLFVRFPISFGVKAEPSRLVGAAGPLASLLVAVVAAPYWPILSVSSLLLGLLSLPPFKPCDGYWIFR